MAFAASKHNNIAPFYLQVAKRDSNGYPVGVAANPDSPTNDTVYGAYVVDGLMDLTPGVPTNPVVTNLGGQKIISRTRMPAQDYGAPSFQLSQRDETFEALVTKSAVDVATNTTRAIRGMNLAQRVWDQFVVMFSILVTNSETGLPQWDHYYYLNAEIAKTADAPATQVTGDATNPNPLAYQLDLSLSLRDITGELISGLATAVQDNTDAGGYFRTNNPVHLVTYVADGTETDFDLPYLPLSSTVTVNASSNHMTINGTVTAAASANTSTGNVGLSGAGSAADKVVLTYETNFVAV